MFIEKLEILFRRVRSILSQSLRSLGQSPRYLYLVLPTFRSGFKNRAAEQAYEARLEGKSELEDFYRHHYGSSIWDGYEFQTENGRKLDEYCRSLRGNHEQ